MVKRNEKWISDKLIEVEVRKRRERRQLRRKQGREGAKIFHDG